MRRWFGLSAKDQPGFGQQFACRSNGFTAVEVDIGRAVIIAEDYTQVRWRPVEVLLQVRLGEPQGRPI
jgi:hypothetical protein